MRKAVAFSVFGRSVSVRSVSVFGTPRHRGRRVYRLFEYIVVLFICSALRSQSARTSHETARSGGRAVLFLGAVRDRRAVLGTREA